MNWHSDAIVVGGGVIGLLTARELAARGLSVALLERDRIGMGSSQAGGGILSPIPPWDAPAEVTTLAEDSRVAFPQLAASLLEATGIDIEYLECGSLFLGDGPTSSGLEWSARTGQKLEVVDAAQLRELEPRLSDRWSRAIWLPGMGQLRNPRLTAALHEDLLKTGVSIVEQAPVETVLFDGAHVTGVRTHDGDFGAPRVVVATGAWTTELLGELSVAPIEPVRGQMLWYKLAPGTFSRIAIESDRYLIPRRDGVCLVGSTVEHVGFDVRTTAQAANTLAAFAARLSPVFADRLPSGQWSGLRPGSTGGVPTISAHPEYAGLFINAGHYRNGINLAPASARRIADLMISGETGPDFSPKR